MIISTLHTVKYSLLELICLSYSSIITYVLYYQNTQLNLNKQHISALEYKMDKLSNSTQELLLRLSEKDKQIEIMLNKSSKSDLLLLPHNNEVYIYIVGGVIIILGSYILCNKLLGLFSFSKFIPASLYSIIQDFTPFLQSTQTYYSNDSVNNLDIMVNIINNKKVNVLVKDSTNTYISFSDFISKLSKGNLSDITTLTTKTDVLAPATETINFFSSFM